MPRRKLSEYRAKQIITKALGIPYEGWPIHLPSRDRDSAKIPQDDRRYVIKVDQAIKGRFKKGLVILDVKRNAIATSIKKLAGSGYEYFIVEPFVTHESGAERYISMAQTREGATLSYSDKGGVDIESNPGSVTTVKLDNVLNYQALSRETAIEETALRALIGVFTAPDNHLTFMEINPYFVADGTITVLDSAIEVDDAGQYFTTTWKGEDIRDSAILTKQEQVIHELDKKSASSFSLSVLNPNGAIFLLLSGGGASVAIADEVYNKGLGKMLANYGEYSGNPPLHEAYKYASQVLDLIIASRAPKKILFIGGAVANFTDVAATFAGVINALNEKAKQLQKQNLTVYVRRGGPNQEEGLKNMTACLKSLGIYGGVYDPSTSIPDALDKALKEFTS
ncbi:MAG TPA: ATP citrate lyase citrate-binding domain-containing protein [Candidatus Saccharimonadales bacterium]|nr:ATP citrate lyase citrate-binding domain-containing protein [Candidatus Saccharimonadales bacterium]